MLRYRIAYDPDRGHFVLPTLAAIARPEETFGSRAAAQTIAQVRNARSAEPLAEESSDSGGGTEFLRMFLRRASA